MAWENSNFAVTARAASAVRAHEPVALLGAVSAASAQDEVIVPVGSVNLDVFGVARASAAVGQPVTVDLTPGFVKAIAAASLGAGARVAVGSTNGRLIPLPLGAVASQVKFSVGVAMQSAVDADIFTVFLKPEQIV
jgi:Uncharacterized conserved protein (DUF2190)